MEAGNSKCKGAHEYVAADGSCRQCEMCPAGFEPTPVSGFLVRCCLKKNIKH